jgi:hypothetical protein
MDAMYPGVTLSRTASMIEHRNETPMASTTYRTSRAMESSLRRRPRAGNSLN